MAIAHDAHTSANSGGAASSLTYSHTCTGSNLILFVSVAFNNTASDTISSIKYNNVSMTLVGKTSDASLGAGLTPGRSYLFYLINPSTGSNSVAIVVSGTASILSTASSYTGAKQSAQPDSSSTGSATGNLALSTTVVGAGCWLVSTVVDPDGSAAGTGTTDRGSGSVGTVGDSNGVVAIGSQSMTWTPGIGGGKQIGVIASFLPDVAPVATGASFLMNFV